MTFTLGLDVGTQGTKAVLLDASQGRVVARASASYGLIAGLEAGAAEQHPDTWRQAVRSVIAEVMESGSTPAGAIVAVAVSGQQHGCVVLDDKDQSVRAAKLWCDTATAAEASELSAAFGRPVPTGFTASKLLWLARNEPENWARTTRVLLPHDYINLLLTGEACMEAGDASGTGLFDIHARAFDEACLEAFDELAAPSGAAHKPKSLAARLPKLMDPARAWEPVGQVTAEAAAEFGLAAGTLVAAGGGDNMMSAIGSGATKPGIVTVSLGTSGTAFTHADKPIVDAAGLIAPFCGSTGGWLPLLCVMNLTGVTEEVRSAFGGDHESLTAQARAVEPGCEGLLWLPFLNGERVPDLPLATGTLIGMRPGLLERGTIYRAALEGTSLNLAWGVTRLAQLGLPIDELRLVGGAAQNPLWREILAACLNAPVLPLAEAESAALGAAMQALWCWSQRCGEGESLDSISSRCISTAGDKTLPMREWTDAYAELGQRFRETVRRLYP